MRHRQSTAARGRAGRRVRLVIAGACLAGVVGLGADVVQTNNPFDLDPSRSTQQALSPDASLGRPPECRRPDCYYV